MVASLTVAAQIAPRAVDERWFQPRAPGPETISGYQPGGGRRRKPSLARHAPPAHRRGSAANRTTHDETDDSIEKDRGARRSGLGNRHTAGTDPAASRLYRTVGAIGRIAARRAAYG